MNSLGAGLPGGIEYFFGGQVAFRGRRGSDVDGFVRHSDMQRSAVGVGVDRDGRDAHLPAGPGNPDGDFTAVGNEYFLEHQNMTGRASCPPRSSFWKLA